MRHYPIFIDTSGRLVLVAGGGAAALAKLRLVLKTEARITVFAADPVAEIVDFAAQGRLHLERRAIEAGDARGAMLVYAAAEEPVEDARIAAIATTDGALINIVDNLEDSAFITPAIVDRDPVTVAIGTEGAAPVLARALKAELEARLPTQTGLLARAGKAFRHLAEKLPFGRARREFWAEYYDKAGPQAVSAGGESALRPALDALLERHLAARPSPGRVDLVGAGPGDPELLTLRARRLLDRADVVIHDRLISAEILELARREAVLVAAGKEGFGPFTPQAEINALMIEHAQNGAHVVRLKSGDPAVFGRLDDEAEALDAAGIDWGVVPGITAASAAAAGIGQSLTKRERNGSVRLLTGHDVKGFAEQDWRALAGPGAVAAIYMGKRAARFLQGRLMMHGASSDTPVTVVENASRPDQRIIAADIATLPEAVADLDGPAVLLLGLAPRAAASVLPQLQEAIS